MLGSEEVKKDFYGDAEWFDKEKRHYEVLPLMALVLLVPLVMRVSVVNLTDLVYKYWDGRAIYVDVFTSVKMITTIIITLFIIGSFTYVHAKRNFILEGNKKYYKYIGIYSIMVIVSTIFSNYKEIALNGFVGKNENIFILLSYMVILFVTIEIVNTEKQIKLITWSIAMGALFMGAIGITQILKNDFWTTTLGQSMILPSKFKELIGELVITMTEGTAYGTLNDTNYMGSFIVLVIPLFVSVMIISKRLISKIILGVTIVIMFINLFGSNSRAGLVGLMIALLALGIVLGKKTIMKYKKLSIIGMLIIIIAGTASYFVLPDNVNPIKRLVSDFTNEDVQEEILSDITIKENTSSIILKDNILNIAVSEDYTVVFSDENNEEITTYINEEDIIVLNDERYETVTAKYNITAKGETLLRISLSNINLFFHMNGDTLYISDNKANDYASIVVDSIGFEGKESLGSGRGFIWSRTLPLILKSPLVGYGADTFAAVFPQNDLKGKIITYGDANQLVDKPHNYYLEVATNTGLISLVAILGIFITYIIGCFKTYKKMNFRDNYYILSLGVFLSVMGYLGAAFYNDSTVAVAPVFWVILGMGIAINWKIEKE